MASILIKTIKALIGFMIAYYIIIPFIMYLFANRFCLMLEAVLLTDEPKNLPPCPCFSTQAVNDPDFQQSPAKSNRRFHPGADTCYRSTRTTQEGSGQQCCYDTDTSLLLVHPSGGTADRYSPVNLTFKWLHRLYDVLPYIICCEYPQNMADCDNYYKYRPTYGCDGYVDPSKRNL